MCASFIARAGLGQCVVVGAFSFCAARVGRVSARRVSYRLGSADCCASEDGAVFILVSLVISVGVALAALVVDHSRETLVLTNIKNAADAAALAGARKLDGTRAGWQDAKRAAVLAIKQNPLHGSAEQVRGTLRLTQGPRNFWDPAGGSHPGVSGKAGGVSVTVERGIFRFDPEANGGEGGFAFQSLEIEVDDNPFDGRVNGSAESYLVGNAVRVKVELDHLRTNVGSFLGVASFANLDTDSIAVADGRQFVEVAPLAVPYCQLLRNPDPYVIVGDHQLDAYDPASQYQREVVFSDANPRMNLEEWNGGTATQVQARRDGITRYESFWRGGIRYFDPNIQRSLCSDEALGGFRVSCKDTILYATIAVPTERPGDEAGSFDVQNAFEQARDGKLLAHVGMYVAPVEDISSLTPSVADSIARFINSGETTVSETFRRPVSPYSDQWVAAPNYPFVRTIRPPAGQHDPEHRIPEIDDAFTGYVRDDRYAELRMYWPSNSLDDAGRRVFHKMLMDHQTANVPSDTRQPGDWVNPLCHDERIALDPNQARVKEVYAMVVAPGVDYRGDGERAAYCDDESLFAGKREKAIGILAKSHPFVIGYVKMLLVDFNLDNLDAKFAYTKTAASPYLTKPTVTPEFPPGARLVVDRHAGELDLERNPLFFKAKERIRSYREELGSCKNEDFQCQLAISTEPSELFSQNLLECFEFEPFFEMLEELEDEVSPCFDDDEVDIECLINTDSGELFENLEKFLDNNVRARDNTHCLPQLKFNRYDRLNPDNYTFGPRDAGCGCCGIRAKLAMMPPEINGRTVLASGRTTREMTPTLVTENAFRP